MCNTLSLSFFLSSLFLSPSILYLAAIVTVTTTAVVAATAAASTVAVGSTTVTATTTIVTVAVVAAVAVTVIVNECCRENRLVSWPIAGPSQPDDPIRLATQSYQIVFCLYTFFGLDAALALIKLVLFGKIYSWRTPCHVT